jgi:hypothetical protein
LSAKREKKNFGAMGLGRGGCWEGAYFKGEDIIAFEEV